MLSFIQQIVLEFLQAADLTLARVVLALHLRELLPLVLHVVAVQPVCHIRLQQCFVCAQQAALPGEVGLLLIILFAVDVLRVYQRQDSTCLLGSMFDRAWLPLMWLLGIAY